MKEEIIHEIYLLHAPDIPACCPGHLTGLLVALSGCSTASGNEATGRETLMQISTIDSLMAGVYDGVTNVGKLKEYGDFGLGTIDKLDGEMVMLDGTVYQVRTDGVAYKVADSATTPFAAVTF